MDVNAAPDGDWVRSFVDAGSDDKRLVARLRREIGETWTDAAQRSARLQAKAFAKFGTGTWWCTERSLAQATPRAVADVKAAWMGVGEVWDLCCGIAGDAMAIAGRSRLLIAIDRDPMMAAMAKANLQASCGGSSSAWQVRRMDVADAQPPLDAVLHIDPDRREIGRRTTRPQDYAPPWSTVQRLLNRCAGAIVKLAPAAELPAETTGHRTWISLRGGVREQSLLTGRVLDLAAEQLNTPLTLSGRSAVILRGDHPPTCFSAEATSGLNAAAEPAAFMIDPDAAIRAAGLTEAFAAEYGCHALGLAAGFLTGPVSVPAPLAVCERLVWFGSPDDRKLRKTLRSMDAFAWRVKTRGVAHNPNELQRRYHDCGRQPLTLWIGKNAKRHYAALTAAS